MANGLSGHGSSGGRRTGHAAGVRAAAPPVQVTRLGVLNGMLRSADTRFALLLTFVVVLAHFGSFTYVTPFLEQVTHTNGALITTFLLLYGAAGILGNFMGGAWVARYPRTVFGLAAGLIGAVTLLLPALGRRETGAVALRVGHRVRRRTGRVANLVRQGGTPRPGSRIGPVHGLLPGNDFHRSTGWGHRVGPHFPVRGDAAGRLYGGTHGPGRRDTPRRAPRLEPCPTGLRRRGMPARSPIVISMGS